MKIIRLEVEDLKVDVVLNILKNLKEDVITKYEFVNDKKEIKDFIDISQRSLTEVWDNGEDSIYDKFL